MLYSVPWQHIGKTADVRLTATMVQFFIGGQLVKTHPRKARGKQTDFGDYPPEKIAFHMRTPAWCRKQAAGIGPACEQVTGELLAGNALYRLRAAQGVIGLADRHDPSRLEAACAKAITAGDPSYRTIKGILAAGAEREQLPAAGRGRRRRGVPARPGVIREHHPHARHVTSDAVHPASARGHTMTAGRTSGTHPAPAGPSAGRPRTRLMRAAAACIEQARIAGLSVWPRPGPDHDPGARDRRRLHSRTAAVALLAAAHRRASPPPTPAPARHAAGSAPAGSSPGTRAHLHRHQGAAATMTTAHRHRPQRARRRAARAEAVRHAGHPRRPPGPGPRRGPRPPGLPPGPVPGRDLPPGNHLAGSGVSAHARFETHATLEGFDFAASPKLPAAQIRDLAALRWLQSGESVILYGPVGVGKSHIAQALAHLAIRSGADARFLKTSRTLAHLAGGHADRTWDKRLRELIRPAVLVLDDFAMREFTAAQADDLYELITERAGKSMILTCNRAPADWYPLFPNPVVAESLLDRIINTSHQVVMNGPSYRPRKRPGRVVPTGTTSTS